MRLEDTVVTNRPDGGGQAQDREGIKNSPPPMLFVDRSHHFIARQNSVSTVSMYVR